jgi:hypothetical protein
MQCPIPTLPLRERGVAPGLIVLGHPSQDMTNLLNDATKPSWGIEIHGNFPYADQMAPQNEHEIAASTPSQDHNLGLDIIPRDLTGYHHLVAQAVHSLVALYDDQQRAA